MPSLTHEAWVQLIRDRPELAPELLRRALGIDLPHYTEVRTESAELLSWPVYVAALRARLGCPASLLVLTPDSDVARGARKPIELGPGGRLEPMVIGPEAVPAIDDPEAARKEPELAVLPAMAHGADADTESAARIALAALEACLGLDAERATFCADVVRIALGGAARPHWRPDAKSRPP